MPRFSCGKYPYLAFYTKYRPEPYRFRVGVFQTDEFEGEEKVEVERVLDRMSSAHQPDVTKDKADAGDFPCEEEGCDRIGEHAFTSMAALYGHRSAHKKDN